MKIRIVAFAFIALFVLAASQTASANEVALQFKGLTDGNSSLNGTPIASGTPFSVRVEFESSAVFPFVDGSGAVPGTGIDVDLYGFQAKVDGTAYAVEPLSSGDVYATEFLDPSNPLIPGVYLIGFGILSGPDDTLALFPGYSTATPAWSAANPTTAAFTGYLGSLNNEIGFSTPGGPLLIDYDSNASISASMVATPEPSAFSLAFLGLGAMAFMSRRKLAALRSR